MTTPPSRPLAAPADVAEYLGITVQALATMRSQHSGPAFVKVGARIRYRWEDVAAWVESQRVDP